MDYFSSNYYNDPKVLWYLSNLYAHYDFFLPHPHFWKSHFLCLVQGVHCDRWASNACVYDRRINYYFFLFNDHTKKSNHNNFTQIKYTCQVKVFRW